MIGLMRDPFFNIAQIRVAFAGQEPIRAYSISIADADDVLLRWRLAPFDICVKKTYRGLEFHPPAYGSKTVIRVRNRNVTKKTYTVMAVTI